MLWPHCPRRRCRLCPRHILLILTGLFLVSPVLGNSFEFTGDFSGRILDGETAGFVPHVARVTGFSMDYSTEGSGIFVTLQHVVTAASLIDGMSIMGAYFGNTSMAAASYRSGIGYMHPDYDRTTRTADIGVIVLGGTIGSGVKPIALPGIPGDDSSVIIEPGRIGTVAGFGLKQNEDRSWSLNFDKQIGSFAVMSENACRAGLGDMRDLITGDHFCTDNLDRMCYGDLGNGITMIVDGVETLIGVVSIITNMCHPAFPVLFTEVEPYVEWIEEMKLVNETGMPGRFKR